LLLCEESAPLLTGNGKESVRDLMLGEESAPLRPTSTKGAVLTAGDEA